MRKKLENLVYSYAAPYENKRTLYVNVVPNYSCTNDCLFCHRHDAEEGESNIYELRAGKSLYLPRAPSVDEIVCAVKKQKEFRGKPEEIAFVGLGEPLLEYKLVRDSIRKLRRNGKARFRIDTNGQVDCWYADAAKGLKEAGLDEIRISVNATNKEDYDILCRPKLPFAYEKMLKFLEDCTECGIDTYASFVIGFPGTKTSQEYRDFILDYAVKDLILRPYVKPAKEPIEAHSGIF